MDDNQFFREATLRICGSLDIQRAMERTLEFLRRVLPADGLLLGLYDPELHIGRSLCHIAPPHWPVPSQVLSLPENLLDRIRSEWQADMSWGMVNDISGEDSEMQEVQRLLWPEDASQLHTDLGLESHRIAVLVVAAQGKGRYTEEHARLLSLLNEPFSIAVANTLRHQETTRLKEMLEDDNRYLHQELRQISGDTIIGADFGLKSVMEMIRQVAPLESPVLLLGETGTGKELLANALHAASPRCKGPLLKVNCGGLPEGLLDSELFGHEKGAFTGAIARKRGRFERAQGGAVFLDEIGELPHAAQVKLLRVLQNREIERVGGSETIPVDVRIVSATHRNLEEMVGRGEFREDLWYRLNVFPIMIPPLRQRSHDIPALVDHLIARKCREMKISRPVRLAPGALERLKAYSWPGNIRELNNQVERALILSQGEAPGVLRLDVQPSQMGLNGAGRAPGKGEIASLDEAVAGHILRALRRARGKIEGPGGAAELLNLHPSTLRGKMRKLHIRAPKG